MKKHEAGEKVMAKDDAMTAFGQSIAHMRELSGLTLAQLAARADLKVGALRAIEAGEGDTSLSTAFKLADALGIPPGDLMRPSGEGSATARLVARLYAQLSPTMQEALLTILQETTKKPGA